KDRIFTGSSDCVVRKYDIANPESQALIIRCDLQVRCLALSHDERFLAVGTEGMDIAIIDLEEAENCWSFKGHKKAVNSLSFDPLGQFLLSSSCDGTVIVWDFKKDASPAEIIKIIEPTTTDSKMRIPVAWHPSNEFFVIGKDKGRCLAWSPNGKFLAASSTGSDLWIWQYKEKENPMFIHKHNNGGITGVAWALNANRLVFTDTLGELSRWDDVVNIEKGSPFNLPKPDPLDGLFDDAAVEDQGIEDNEMAQDYASGDESLDDFIVEDETGTYLEKKPVSGAQKSGLKTKAIKELHPRFQSGSTSTRDDRRYLAFNLLGLITSVNHGTHATISVEFHDKVAYRGFHFLDNFHYSMACLGMTGTLFAAVASDGNPSTVFYKTYDSWATKSEWQVYLPEGEDVTGSQNLGYSIYNVETGQRIQQGTMPVPDDTFITWLGFSEGGIPAFYDDKGV
ncbi:hypothetical protein BGZ65_007672, partial [Modicella reniformis]